MFEIHGDISKAAPVEEFFEEPRARTVGIQLHLIPEAGCLFNKRDKPLSPCGFSSCDHQGICQPSHFPEAAEDIFIAFAGPCRNKGVIVTIGASEITTLKKDQSRHSSGIIDKRDPRRRSDPAKEVT
jgi:hypothetical protein